MKQLDTIKSELKEMLIQVADLHDYKPQDIGDTDPLFGAGLGLDSIDVLEIAVNLDKKYGLKIKNDQEGQKILSNINTMADAVMHQLQV